MISLRLSAVLLVLLGGTASATVTYQNNLPTASASFAINGLGSSTTPPRADVGVIYGTHDNASSVSEPFILGDQFTTSVPSTVTSVTVYEISNTPTSGLLTDADPTNEFNSISLYLGSDGNPLSLASSSYTSARVLNTDSSDYESITSTANFYIFQITFSGLNFDLGAAGLFDFAIGAVPNKTNTFALLTSDTGAQSGGAAGQPNQGFVYSFLDGNGGTAYLPEVLYNPGDISGFTGNTDLNIDVVGSVTTITTTPEPATFGLIGLSLGALMLRLRRRAR